MSLAELEIERLVARVGELEREKAAIEEFAAVAAHELVEPLVMTEAYAAILSDRLEGPEHEDSRQDLDALGRGMSRMRLLVEGLLHDARSGHREIARREVDFDALVHDCLSLLRPEIEARAIRVEVGKLPTAIGDEVLLNGLLSNLLINALKYSPRRDALIRIGGSRDITACRYFVDSEGPVVHEEDRERIFELYQRGRGERRATGAGLGLSICRRVVDRHGGEIGVVPAPGGEGNRFHFTLPA